MKKLSWRKKRQQARKEAEDMLEQRKSNAKGLLDTSSAKNRNILIFFLLFCTYVFVTTVSTTDMQLLEPNSSVRLPLLGISLPLFGYYLIAPMLVIVFHLNILLNLHEHLKKLETWLEGCSNRRDITRELIPFVVDFAFCTRAEDPFRLFFSLMYLFITYIIPLVVLGTILIRFGDYQSPVVSTAHLIALTTDFVLLVFYHRKVPFPFKKRRKQIYQVAYLFLFGLLMLIPYSFWILITLVSLASHPKIHVNPLHPFLQDNKLWITLDSLAQTKFFPHLNISSNSQIPLPNLDLANSYQKILGNGESISDFKPRFDLSNRSLRWAQLNGAFIPYVDLSGTRMEKAVLTRANLAGANLTDTLMAEVDLTEAQLPRATFTGAQLQSANLLDTVMTRANLSSANLADATLSGAQIDEGNLSSAYMPGTVLNSTLSD